MRTLRLKNVLYFPGFNSIGGIETYCYEMGLKFGKDFDITVLYRNGDPDMMRKIAETCRVIKYRDGDKVICDVFIFGYGHDILDQVEAKEYIQTFHADYINRFLNPCGDKRITKRFGVAENTTKGIRDHFDWAADIVTMYNPYTPKKPRKVLNLISATRLTAEKGLDRMIRFANALDEANIPFHWTVYTDIMRPFPNKSVAVMEHRHDIIDFIADADYLVQLSDTEGYSYSIVEALSVGTPVIVTEIPVAGEQGVVDGKTGFILPFDMGRIPIEEIYKGLKKFTVTPRESLYNTVFSPGKCEYEDDVKSPVKIRVTRRYYDMKLEKELQPGMVFEVSAERADELVEKGLVKYDG